VINYKGFACAKFHSCNSFYTGWLRWHVYTYTCLRTDTVTQAEQQIDSTFFMFWFRKFTVGVFMHQTSEE